MSLTTQLIPTHHYSREICKSEHSNYSQFLNSSEAEPRGGLMENEVFEFTNLVIILTNNIYFIWSVSLITLINRKNQLIIASLPQIHSEAESCTGILRHRNHHMISCTPLSNRSTISLLCCSPFPHWRAYQWVDRRGWFLVQQVVTPFWTKDMLLIHIFGLAKCLKTAYFCSGRSSVETSVVEDVLDRVS